jgi:hypothetical protein
MSVPVRLGWNGGGRQWRQSPVAKRLPSQYRLSRLAGIATTGDSE